MSTQQVPRHRAAPRAANPRRTTLGTAGENRALIAAAGTVFAALLVLALGTLPARSGSTTAPPPDSLAGLEDSSTFPDSPLPATASIAPPSSVTRGHGKHPNTGAGRPGPLPPLTKQPLAGGSGSPSAHPPSARTARPGGSSNPPAPTVSALPDPAQVAQAVFDAINASRRDAGRRALRWSSQLQDSAHQHNLEMARYNTLSHQLPGEDSLGNRESQAGVTVWWWAAENIAESSTLTAQSALDLESAMVNEQAPDDGHRQNILASNADVVGVDILFDTAHNRLWLTEDFAQTSLL